jgi:hypothetical protein
MVSNSCTGRKIFPRPIVTDCGVIEHLPDLGHWVLDSDLLFKDLRN